MEDRMRNPRMGFLTVISFAMVLGVFLSAGSAKAQVFPNGLVGLSSSSPGVVYRINEFTGAATPIVTLDSNWSIVGLAYLGQTLYGTDLECQSQCANYAVASISPNGGTNVISEQNGSFNWWALAADETERVMYSIDINNSLILMAQYPDGSIVSIGSGTGINGSGMAYDDTNGILYAVDDGTSLYTISVTDGTSTLVGPLGFVTSIHLGLEYNECNQTLYMNDGDTGLFYSVDVNTGAATLIGSNGLTGIDGLAWKGSCELPGPTPIPTMSEWGLMIMAAFIGIAGILTYRKRRLAA